MKKLKEFLKYDNIFARIYWFLKSFIGVYFSPFKAPKVLYYFGEITCGTPYFLPRKLNKKTKTYVPRKFGLDLIHLGWKTKWTADDIRHEWNPAISFVAFGKQLYFQFSYDYLIEDVWCAWLYYSKYTNKKLSKKDRLNQTIDNYSLTYTKYSKDNSPIVIDYYPKILK